jgi:hypothetical protein
MTASPKSSWKEPAAIVNTGGAPDLEKLKVVWAGLGLVPALPPTAER